ncbi:MAG: aspartate aminotransferase family protein [Alphaproteobacteria bacterium]|nr:aspartate aminotransferase family protein [Alphaproteobacteria bacterium]
MPDTTRMTTNTLEPYWMPFTANRQFKSAPRMMVSAKDMHYTDGDGRRVLDGTAGMWCVNAGHCRQEIVEAVQAQVGRMDYAPAFQWGHPGAFELAAKIAALCPGDIDHVFYSNSGSEAVDTALKIALAYWRAKGQAHRTRFIGRERGYHGVGFGGTAVGGISNNRKQFGNLLAGVDHLPHTLNLKEMAFTRGQPSWGAHLADELERLVALHDPSTIAAVIVEPVQGSTGVIVPPQVYLQKLRQICDKHGILLIFDEVITGFGRLGTPFGAQYFDIVPDMITMAKGLTNATVPMAATAVRKFIYDGMMDGPQHVVELFHGYTYSGHPLACAAGLATLEIYAKEGLFERAKNLAPYWEDALHSLKGVRHVVDIRNLGLMGAVELEPHAGAPGVRTFEAYIKCFEHGLLIRQTGEVLALSPPLIVEKKHIDEIVATIRKVLADLP